MNLLWNANGMLWILINKLFIAVVANVESCWKLWGLCYWLNVMWTRISQYVVKFNSYV